MQIAYYFLLLSAAQNALCWGNVGHGTVAYLAQKYLTENTASYLAQLLVDEQGEAIDYFEAAIWADEVKHGRPYSAEWHYIGNSCLTQICSISLTPLQMPKTHHLDPAE